MMLSTASGVGREPSMAAAFRSDIGIAAIFLRSSSLADTRFEPRRRSSDRNDAVDRFGSRPGAEHGRGLSQRHRNRGDFFEIFLARGHALRAETEVFRSE